MDMGIISDIIAISFANFHSLNSVFHSQYKYTELQKYIQIHSNFEVKIFIGSLVYLLKEW